MKSVLKSVLFLHCPHLFAWQCVVGLSAWRWFRWVLLELQQVANTLAGSCPINAADACIRMNSAVFRYCSRTNSIQISFFCLQTWVAHLRSWIVCKCFFSNVSAKSWRHFWINKLVLTGTVGVEYSEKSTRSRNSCYKIIRLTSIIKIANYNDRKCKKMRVCLKTFICLQQWYFSIIGLLQASCTKSLTNRNC